MHAPPHRHAKGRLPWGRGHGPPCGTDPTVYPAVPSVHPILRTLLWFACVVLVVAAASRDGAIPGPAGIEQPAAFDDDGSRTTWDGSDEQDDDGPEDAAAWSRIDPGAPSPAEPSAIVGCRVGAREGVVRGVFRPPA